MDKIKIGIPRSLFYYYYGPLWQQMFKKMNIDVILSPPTTKEIMNFGNFYSYDEMCLSLKNYIGHVAFLIDKCDYILIPRIDNFGINNQTCTNFLAVYDIIKNLFNKNIINYNVNLDKKETELQGFIEIGKKFNISKTKIKKFYYEIKKELELKNNIIIKENIEKLNSKKTKILLIGHPYNIFDNYIGLPLKKILEKLNVEIIYSEYFNKKETNEMSKYISSSLYWKYSKENVGCIPIVSKKIDGIIFLSTFPCGLDSLVNELTIRKLKLPILNLIIDDIDSLTGFETRLESFIDVVNERRNYIA